MKQKVLELLQTKFDGVDAKILDRLADKLSKDVTTEEECKTAVDGVTFQKVLESYGDSRATDAQKTAVANYERKHGLKDGKPAKGADQKPEEKPDKLEEEEKGEKMPAWAKAIIDQNKALQDKISEMEGEKVATSRQARLSKLLEKAPEKIRARYEKDFQRLNFKDADDFDGWISEITPDIESITADYARKGGIVSRPMSGGKTGTGEDVNPMVKARYEAKASESAPKAIQGLPDTGTAAKS